MPTELERLRTAVLERHGSIHAFCRDRKLCRTTVYTVLNGRYQGDVVKQVSRIRASLLEADRQGGEGGGAPTLMQLEDAIRRAACERCPVSDVQQCRLCAPTHLKQAEAVRDLLATRGF